MFKKSIIFSNLVLLGLLGACGESAVTRTRSELSTDPIPSPVIATLVAVVDATASECPSGGSAIVTYLDANASGDLDQGDVTRSRSKICNGSTGAPGSSGYGAGILVQSAAPQSCPAGGSTFTTFVDKNNNALQEDDESTTSFTTLCAGTNLIMGAVGAPVSGKIYSACHHDYLFFPDPSGGTRGWLSFRHQANGSADQGIGSTGFQIWNVDTLDGLQGTQGVIEF